MEDAFTAMRQIFESGSATVLNILGIWVLTPLIIFFILAWVLKIRGSVFTLSFAVFAAIVLIVFVRYGLPTITETFFEKVGQ